MEKLQLRNVKTETIVFALLALALGLVIAYWGSKGNLALKISGAKFDPKTSSILLYIISLGPAITAINLFIKYFSVARYGEFAVILDNHSITYPHGEMFKGFKPVQIEKSKISQVFLVDKGKQSFEIRLANAENQYVGSISGDLCPHKTMPPKDLANKIQQWANS